MHAYGYPYTIYVQYIHTCTYNHIHAFIFYACMHAYIYTYIIIIIIIIIIIVIIIIIIIIIIVIIIIIIFFFLNSNNNNHIQRRYSIFFTISSQRRELSPTRTLKWPGRNRVQITCNTSSAYRVQVSCFVPLGTKGQLSY